MAENPLWSAQALQYDDTGRSSKVIYFQSREELEAVLQPFRDARVARDVNEMHPRTFNISNTAPTSGGHDGNLAARWREIGDALFNSTPEKMNQDSRFKEANSLENYKDIKKPGGKTGGVEKGGDRKEGDKPRGSRKVPTAVEDKKGGKEKEEKPEDIKDAPGKEKKTRFLVSMIDDSVDNQNLQSVPLEELSTTTLQDILDAIAAMGKGRFLYKYALVSGLTSVFNPSGVWIVEDGEELQY